MGLCGQLADFEFGHGNTNRQIDSAEINWCNPPIGYGILGELSLNGKIEPGSPDRFCIMAAAFVAILAAALCVFSYERHPHVTDEVAYLTQVRFLPLVP